MHYCSELLTLGCPNRKMLYKLRKLAGSHGALRFGPGLISGMVALTLSVLCLLGVAAFHFPHYLTTPELRQSYSADLMRQAMYWAMVLTGALSLYNVIFSRARWLAALAFGLLAITLALGGTTVQVEAYPQGTANIGLDWFILDLLGSTLIFVFIEKLCPLRREQPVFRAHWQTDMQHFVVNL